MDLEPEKLKFWRNVASAYTKDYGYNPYLDSQSEDDSINFDLDQQRYLAEEICQNHPVAKSVIEALVKSINGVGGGLRISVDTDDDDLNDQLEELINDYSKSKQCDAVRQYTLDDIFKVTARNLFTVGTSYGVLVKSPTVFGTAFRGISWHSVKNPDSPKSDKIIKNGVEINKWGDFLALWVEMADGNFKGYKWTTSDGSPQVLQAFEKKFYNQTNGQVPWTSVYKMLLDLSVFIRSEVNAAATASQINILQTRKNAAAAQGNLGFTEKTVETPTGQQTIRVPIVAVRPGTTLNMQPGDEIVQFKMERPASGFVPFVEYVTALVCSAVGYSWEYVFTKWSDSNYTSNRTNCLQTQARLKDMQDLIIEQTIRPIVETMVTNVIESKFIKTDKPVGEILKCITIAAPNFPLLDPQREVAAATARIDGNFSTHQKEAKTLGLGDYKDTFAQIGREKKEMIELGVVEQTEIPGQVGKPPGENSTRG